MILPSNWPPEKLLTLKTGISITSNNRAEIRYINDMSIGVNTIEVLSQDEEIFKKWVLFHTFILDTPKTIKHFESEGYGLYKLILTKNESSNKVDYDNLLKYVYFNNNIPEVKMAYVELYEKFINISSKKIDMIANFYTKFSGDTFLSGRQVIDSSYWQLVVYFSIVDAMFEQQQHCFHKLKCNEKDTKTSHFKEKQSDWFERHLSNLIKDPVRRKEYMQVIELVKKKIRNSTVHASRIPPPKGKVQFIPGGHEIYDIERSLKEYESDESALDALKYMMRDITRFLLLNYIFDINIFPSIKPLHVKTWGSRK